MYYIGLDVHKRIISFCVKEGSGKLHSEGKIPATRFDLNRWMKTLPQPWSAAMEATMFSGWIYDHLKPHAAALKVAHPLMLRAIAAAKKKNDRIDANKICDCLRCDFLPECYMAPTAIRERRRTLRYRNLLVRQMVQMKIKIGTLLMEAGVSYNKQKLHKAGYFRELLTSNPDINEGLRPLLRLCRETVVRLSKLESALVRSLERDQFLVERVERLMSIPAIGPITALTWALEIGEVQRFSSIKKAISYCGLCGAEKSSGNTVQRTPLSKQRNKHLQTTLIEAAKMAPRNSSQLAMLYDKERQKGNANCATLAVARKCPAFASAGQRTQEECFQIPGRKPGKGHLFMDEEYSTTQSKPASRVQILRPFIPAWVREILCELKGAPLSVLVAYWSHANREGIAWPSNRFLARTTGYSETTVKAAKKQLLALGLLNAGGQLRKGGKFGRKEFSTVVKKPDHSAEVKKPADCGKTDVGKPDHKGLPSEGFPSNNKEGRPGGSAWPHRSAHPRMRNFEKQEEAYRPEVVYA